MEKINLTNNAEEAVNNEETKEITEDVTVNREEQIERFIQAKIDKYLAKERKEKVELRKQLDDLKKLKLNEDELKQLELEEKEKTIADREKAILEKENRLYAVKAIKEAGLDDGSETSLGLVDFVLGEDQTQIDAKIKTFKALFDKAVKSAVEQRFKAGGSTPAKSSNFNMGENPYLKDSYNFTAQMRLETENPELAAQLRAAAGIK